MKKVLIVIALLLPMVVSADSVLVDGIYYTLLPKGKIASVASNPNKYSGNIIIPDSIDYEGICYNVTSIAGYAFSSSTSLTSVTIPNGVTSIGTNAFADCTSLKAIVIPNSVLSLGSYAFYGCSNLTTITIPNGVTSLAQSVFQGCKKITTINIPQSVMSIEKNAFTGCSSLTSVNIFDLEAWCNITFEDYTSNPLNVCHNLMLNGDEVKDLVIPDNVESISSYAFQGCSNFTSVSFPNSVKKINESAFVSCSNLTSVFLSNNLKTIENSVFSGCKSLTSITIPYGVTSIGLCAFQGCYALNSLSIPSSVTSIGVAAFYYCTSLETVVIPNSTTNIDKDAFSSCSSLKSLIIGSGIKNIGSYAFGNCKELLDVYCYAEVIPTTNLYSFSGSYTEYVTLHVPNASIERYKTTEPWSSFGYFKNLDDEEPPVPEKCATPTIAFANGKLTFECETEGVEFMYNISLTGGQSNSGNEVLLPSLQPTYNVSVYAKKDGYENSDVVTYIVTYQTKAGDANGDGEITIADAVKIVDIVLGNNSNNARMKTQVGQKQSAHGGSPQ